MTHKLDKLFRTAVQYRASDIYITTGSKPILRINGDLIQVQEHPVLSKKMAEDYILEVMSPRVKKRFEQKLEVNFSLDIEDISRFRVNTFVQRKGIAAIFRVIPNVVYGIDELGLPQQLKKVTQYPHGLVIVTGPTGSGKTTSLAAMINEINEQSAKHIITIEDPIEYVHDNKKSIIEQREVGHHTQSFSQALENSLRQDPDIILIGELDNLETIQLAITAAETGHLTFATLHTSGAAKAIDRIVDVFPPTQQNQIRMQLSESLKAVIWQNLVKTKDKKGRMAACEIMFVNHAIANMIRKSKTHQIDSILETGMREGMQTMKKAVMDLLQADLISEEEAIIHIPQEFEL